MTGQELDHFGYRATILRGVWERIMSFGVPRFYSHAWAAVCLFLGLLLLTKWGFRWLVIPLCLWLAGYLTLVALAQWNAKWDDMALAQMNRRYKSRYDAG